MAHPSPRRPLGLAAVGLLAMIGFTVWSESVGDLVNIDIGFPHLINAMLFALAAVSLATGWYALRTLRPGQARWTGMGFVVASLNLALVAVNAFGWLLVGG